MTNRTFEAKRKDNALCEDKLKNKEMSYRHHWLIIKNIHTCINILGKMIFSFYVDDPKPPGPVDLEENVPGTVTVSWAPSPDEKKDDRLHYMITKRDSVKRDWQTVADRLFNNKYTAINIMPGRQYHFRVYARNDMGLSEPSESPTWEVKVKKGKCKKIGSW